MSDPSLVETFARLIQATGPISVAQFMAEANARYYTSRDPMGVSGDFVTAPEISQMFGELIGLWLVDLWDRAGRPAPIYYVEPGAGRGTLSRDALKAAARFGLRPHVHFIEPSPPLRACQRALFPDAIWHDDFATLPEDAPLLIVANEFLDALPIRQLVKVATGWRERMVGWDSDARRLIPVAGGQPMDAAVPAQWTDLPDGTILETCPAAAAMVGEIAGRIATQGGAALLIDYGLVASQPGSTLQAVAAHRKVDPFALPGMADLTALVDFAALIPVIARQGARWLGTVEQGAWLGALGIGQRAAALARAAPGEAPAVAAAVTRLTDAAQMGALFKVMGLAAPDWPDGAGFGR